MTATVSDLKEQINAGRYDGLSSAPLLAVMMMLEAFFANFNGRAQGGKPEETCSLTPECLTVVSKTYQVRVAGREEKSPGGGLPSGAAEKAAVCSRSDRVGNGERTRVGANIALTASHASFF